MEKITTIHPLWIVIEVKGNEAKIRLTNETSLHLVENHLLLGKQKIPKTDKQINGKGLEMVYDLEKKKDSSEIYSLLNNFANFFPDHGQPLSKNLFNSCFFQDC